MFNKKSLHGIRNKFSSIRRVDKDNGTHEYHVESSQKEFLVRFAGQAMRFGLLLSHQARLKKATEGMVKSLFIKNFPDKEFPSIREMDIEEFEHLIDEESGLHFHEIIHNQVLDDWANDPSTKFALDLIQITTETGSPEEFLTFMKETVTEMRSQFSIAMELDSLSDSLN